MIPDIELTVGVIATALTVFLIILNYVILRASVEQNRKSIELYEKNLKISEETLQLNRSMLEENRRLIEHQELDNRPKFRMKQDGFRFDTLNGRPCLYLENIGGKEATVRNIHVVITKDAASVVKDMEMNKSIKPGAPMNIEVDLPASVIEYKVERKDGTPLKDHEMIFLSVSARVEYTHADEESSDTYPFADNTGFSIGNDYLNNAAYVHTQTVRESSEEDTWYGILRTGTGSRRADRT